MTMCPKVSDVICIWQVNTYILKHSINNQQMWLTKNNKTEKYFIDVHYYLAIYLMYDIFRVVLLFFKAYNGPWTASTLYILKILEQMWFCSFKDVVN